MKTIKKCRVLTFPFFSILRMYIFRRFMPDIYCNKLLSIQSYYRLKDIPWNICMEVWTVIQIYGPILIVLLLNIFSSQYPVIRPDIWKSVGYPAKKYLVKLVYLGNHIWLNLVNKEYIFWVTDKMFEILVPVNGSFCNF